MPGFGRNSRKKSGKLLRQALYQDVYAWKPIPPDFNAKPFFGKEERLRQQRDRNAAAGGGDCLTCDGKVVDNLVTYVEGGSCGPPAVAAYVACDYVL